MAQQTRDPEVGDSTASEQSSEESEARWNMNRYHLLGGFAVLVGGFLFSGSVYVVMNAFSNPAWSIAITWIVVVISLLAAVLKANE